mmetsp:Transcript_69147/g.84782  ORF Transcript_69147/g.84782 Transcript_69147/m.84782 type:complete len:100 (+) Transcript_69147:122-421(+)
MKQYIIKEMIICFHLAVRIYGYIMSMMKLVDGHHKDVMIWNLLKYLLVIQMDVNSKLNILKSFKLIDFGKDIPKHKCVLKKGSQTYDNDRKSRVINGYI